MGVFRITRAEFAKVFKKPTVYIMAFLLAIVLVISLLSYSPNLREVKSASIDGDNATAVYNIFNGESLTSDTKLKFDNEYFTPTDNQITFYNNIYLRSKNLNSAYLELEHNYTKLTNTFNTNNNSGELPQLMEDVKDGFDKVLTAYGDISAYINYENLTNIVNCKSLNSNVYFETKFFDVLSTSQHYNYTTLKNNYIPEIKTVSLPGDFIGRINTNGYMTIIKNMVNYGENLIYSSLNDLLEEVETIQKEYIQLVSGDLTTYNKELICQKAINLNLKINEYKTLVEGLVSNSAILVIHTDQNYNKLLDAFDNFKMIYQDIKVDDPTDFTTKKAGAIALKNSSYIAEFKNYLDSLSFINPTEEFVKKLNDHSEIAHKNQETILSSITSKKSEISTAPIMEDITNYMLLGETYAKITDCEVISQFSQNLSLSDTQNAKNIDLKDFNSYENNSTISSLSYQLTNNVYYNEIGGSLSLNQTMSSEKNMYDFTYYALKISTFLIIIFTIMMIANLITSETDSGTIKLLLIRPYRRSTILFGKILATFFFSLSFLLFSFIVSMVSGYFMFGAPTISKVLVTFNASKSFLISPLLLILLFFVSCAGDILFYLIIALMISVLFRSYIGAISTSLVVCIGAMVVGAFLSSSVIYAYLPFTNISWFRYFGGEIMPVNSGIGALLSSPVHSFQNIWLSMGITTIFSIIMLIITFTTFKKRDF